MTGSLEVTNIALQREGKKFLPHGVFVFGKPSKHDSRPAEQGLSLLSEQNAVQSLWFNDSTLENFFSQKMTMIKKILEKRNEKENPPDYTCFADRTRSRI